MYIVQEGRNNIGLATMYALYQKGAIPFPGFGSAQTMQDPFAPGKYQWNNSTATFYRTSAGPAYTFTYPDAGLLCENTRLVVEAYEDIVTRAHRRFPTILQAALYLDNIQRLAVEHRAVLEEGLPSVMETRIEGDTYSVSVGLGRTRTAQKGKLNLKVDLAHKLRSLITLDLRADLLYHDPGYSAQSIEIDLHILGKRIVGHIAYGDIDPTSAHYVRDFNRRSNLLLLDDHGDIIGDILLAYDDVAHNTQDFAVRFSDGSTAMLKQYVLPFDALMNLKF
jgi:hypothetical protein